MALIGTGSFNGLSWGPASKYHIAGVQGLADMPAVRTFDAPRPGDDGVFRGIDRLGPRIITLDIAMVGDDYNDYVALGDALETAFAKSEAELPLLFFGSSRLINCRCRRRSIPYEADHPARTGVATVELFASDPRKYDAVLQNLSTGMAQSGGGMTFPATFNLSFGATGSGGLIQLTNSGNYSSRPVLTVTGPCDTPILSSVTQGKKLRFNLNLGASDFLVVDLDARTVLLNGTASRRSTLTADSDWWEIPPGANTVSFTNAGAYQAAAALSIPFRSAWL